MFHSDHLMSDDCHGNKWHLATLFKFKFVYLKNDLIIINTSN